MCCDDPDEKNLFENLFFVSKESLENDQKSEKIDIYWYFPVLNRAKTRRQTGAEAQKNIQKLKTGQRT